MCRLHLGYMKYMHMFCEFPIWGAQMPTRRDGKTMHLQQRHKSVIKNLRTNSLEYKHCKHYSSSYPSLIESWSMENETNLVPPNHHCQDHTTKLHYPRQTGHRNAGESPLSFKPPRKLRSPSLYPRASSLYPQALSWSFQHHPSRQLTPTQHDTRE